MEPLASNTVLTIVGTFRESFRWEGRDLPILPFENDKLVIDDERRLVLKVVEEPYCDGATGAPDTWRGMDLAAGYIAHDALYKSLEDFLADPNWMAAGWNEYSLMTLFDIVLGKKIHRPSDEEPVYHVEPLGD